MTKQNMTSPGAGPIAHTPIPWRVNADFGEIEGDFGDNAITVAKFFDRATDGFSGARAARAERDVNVELACRAVNSHAALLAALRLTRPVVARDVEQGRCPPNLLTIVRDAIAAGEQLWSETQQEQNMKNTEIQTALRVVNEAAIELTVTLKNAHHLACGDEAKEKLLEMLLLETLGEAVRVQHRIERIREATR